MSAGQIVRPTATPSRLRRRSGGPGRADATRTLRVLHIVEAFGGGVFEMTKRQAEAAAQAGHRVGIAYGRRPETPQDVRAAIHPAVELFETPWTQRTVVAQLRAARYLRGLVGGWHPDVVHLQSSFAGALGTAVLYRQHAALVYTPHGYASTMSSASPWVRRLVRLIERGVSTRVTLVGAISASEAEIARRDMKARRVRVIQNGIPELDPDNLARVPPAPKRPAVRAIGRLSPQRQPEACARILSAIADIADVGWIGGGDPAGPQAEALRRAGIPATGWLPHDQTLRELGRVQVYLHWTAWDGLPLSVLEAMARDVVVVASDIPANRELLGPEQVFTREPDAIDAIRRALNDPEWRDRCLENQRTRRDYYSAERMNTEWLTVYQQLATARNA